MVANCHPLDFFAQGPRIETKANKQDEQGLNKDNLEAAIELSKLVACETGLCCEELGQFTWACYKKLEGEE